MRIVIVTGMSGAGKSSVLHLFEDMGYYCMDNLPPQLIPNFLDLAESTRQTLSSVALGVDIRGGEFFDDLLSTVEKLKKRDDLQVTMLFLTASDEALVRRYKELRRPHPMDKAGNIFDGIQREKVILANLRLAADEVVDTSRLTLGQLKEVIDQLFLPEGVHPTLSISVVSFGFKHGILLDADLVFDVRFVQNPYYIEAYKELDGTVPALREFVLSFPETRAFLEKAEDLVGFLAPLYLREGKRTLVIGMGCTGGRHRSVAMAEVLAERLEARFGAIQVSHRDRKYWS
ncbi:MAG: RNase adapter RapZ [Peptoniphilaceae bacterium]|nr:RNase adapter RapZ [Peptoniphilaceae bacterium]MDY6085809.1 RNase adapter RapZ [Peptoniphilaceae bacterium]